MPGRWIVTQERHLAEPRQPVHRSHSPRAWIGGDDQIAEALQRHRVGGLGEAEDLVIVNQDELRPEHGVEANDGERGQANACQELEAHRD
jgi:hypothetical protein